MVFNMVALWLACVLVGQVVGVYFPPIDHDDDSEAPEKKVDVDYGIVIDMGSKGSRVSIFIWPSDSSAPYTEVTFGGGSEPWYFKITPGVATFASDPAAAGPYLKPLLDFAATNVPVDKYSTTPIFIHGTDNMRQLPFNQADQILASISNYTASNYKFLMTPNSVSLLPGILEGSFMWVAANYLQQNFQQDSHTIGTLDMGSGSTQIAFIPKAGTAIPNGYYYTFTYDKEQYTPYVHSYTGYGYVNSLYSINSTILQSSSGNVIYNPCMLSGYSTSFTTGERGHIVMHGTGSWAQCSALTYSFLNTSGFCAQQPCNFDGAYQPSLHGDFIAVSNYVDVSNFLGYKDSVTVQNLIDGGVKFCALTWQEAVAQYPSVTPSDLATYCFGANYISALLSKGYGFDMTTTISISKTYDNSPYTWALGAMIYELQVGW